jgi:hypothetical protein
LGVFKSFLDLHVRPSQALVHADQGCQPLTQQPDPADEHAAEFFSVTASAGVALADATAASHQIQGDIG